MFFRWLLRFVAYLAALIMAVVLIAYLTGYGYLVKGVRLSYLSGHTSANIYDGQDFDTREVANGTQTAPLPSSSKFNTAAPSKALSAMLEETSSTSFLVLHKDSLVWENYYQQHTDSTASNSFSMAKTITTLLVQRAIQEGKIKSWDAPAIQYLTWLEGPYAKTLTLRHLSTMTAGLDWKESYYDPFGITARLYYGDAAEETMKKVKVTEAPGNKFVYQSGATQLLGLCLAKATGKPVAELASEWLWKPIGAERKATWHTDAEGGMELTYCCFNAITRDYARLGSMLLHHGKVNNAPLIDSSFIAQATKGNLDPVYGQALWIGATGKVAWYALQGTLGQYIAVVPAADLVIVRTGNKQKKSVKGRIPDCLQTYVDESIKQFAPELL